jgi:hypothetical protein
VKWRWYYDLFIVFIVSGLWHGASWTFIVWGTLHGFYQVFGFMTKEKRAALAQRVGLPQHPRLHRALQTTTVFALVSFAWIFFRANLLSEAVYIASHSLTGLGNVQELFYGNWQHLVFLDTSAHVFTVSVCAVLLMEIIHRRQEKVSFRDMVASWPSWRRWSLYYTFVVLVLLFGQFGEGQFIYFQF